MRVCRPNPAPLPLGREGDLEHTDATTHAVGVACGRWFALSCSARCSTISHFHCPGALVIQAFPSTHITQRPPDGRQMGATDRWDFGHVLMCMTRPVMFRCPFPISPTPYISFCPQYSRWARCKAHMCSSALPTSFPSSLENRQSHTLSRHYTMLWCAHLCCVTTSDRLRCIHRPEVGGRDGGSRMLHHIVILQRPSRPVSAEMPLMSTCGPEHC